jgi:ATP-dependent HslUV protease ATP-binding subunit HslU
MSQMSPREIVQELDSTSSDQDAAKRAVAIALRNRWRRAQLPETPRGRVTPKNILMIGPHRRRQDGDRAPPRAPFASAPFVKIEATKFTEVGYVGRDVDSIVRELVDVAVKLTRELEMEKGPPARAEDAAEERVMAAPASRAQAGGIRRAPRRRRACACGGSCARAARRARDRDERTGAPLNVQIMTPPGLEEMSNQLESLFKGMSPQRPKRRRLKVREARKLVLEEEAAKLINDEELKSRPSRRRSSRASCSSTRSTRSRARAEAVGADVSREGVQRDLLPLVEGCTVSTKYGMVRTDHVLFIASGAFHVSKPVRPDPELQGVSPSAWSSTRSRPRTSCASSRSPTAACASSTRRS